MDIIFFDTMDNPILAYESPKSLQIPFHHLNPVEYWLYSQHSCDEAEYSTILESKPIPTHRKSGDKPTQSIEQVQQNIDRIQTRAHAVSTVFAALCRWADFNRLFRWWSSSPSRVHNIFNSHWAKLRSLMRPIDFV